MFYVFVPDHENDQKFIVLNLDGEIWMNNLHLDDAVHITHILNDFLGVRYDMEVD